MERGDEHQEATASTKHVQVTCIAADLNKAEGEFKLSESIYDGEPLGATTYCVDFIVTQKDDQAPVLIYRFQIGELLKAIAEQACHTTGVYGIESDNEWDAHADNLPLIIPFLMIPLTQEHMRVIVRAVFRRCHFRNKAVARAFAAYFRSDSNIPSVALRLLQYVYCQGFHAYTAMNALRTEVVKALFGVLNAVLCEEDCASSLVKRFTLAHLTALQCSLQELFGLNCVVAASSCISSQRWKLAIIKDIRQHATNGQILRLVHNLVDADSFNGQYVYRVLPFETGSAASGPKRAIVMEPEMKMIHKHIRDTMRAFFTLQLDEESFEDVAKQSHILHMIFLYSFEKGGPALRNLKQVIKGEFQNYTIKQTQKRGFPKENVCLFDYCVDTTHILKKFIVSSPSPADVFLHAARCSASLVEYFHNLDIPLVAVLSPYTQSIVYNNGLWYFISRSICNHDNCYPTPTVEDHYRNNIVWFA